MTSVTLEDMMKKQEAVHMMKSHVYTLESTYRKMLEYKDKKVTEADAAENLDTYYDLDF